jgi:hypothetical protein
MAGQLTKQFGVYLIRNCSWASKNCGGSGRVRNGHDEGKDRNVKSQSQEKPQNSVGTISLPQDSSARASVELRFKNKRKSNKPPL